MICILRNKWNDFHLLQLPIPKPDKGDHRMRKIGGGTRVAAQIKMEGENTKGLSRRNMNS